MVNLVSLGFLIFFIIVMSAIFIFAIVVSTIKFIKRLIINSNFSALNNELYGNYQNSKNKDASSSRIIPDDVHEERPTNKSTQKQECKIYDVDETYIFKKVSKVKKTIIKNNVYNKKYQRNIKSDGPIAEKESILSKIFKGPDRL